MNATDNTGNTPLRNAYSTSEYYEIGRIIENAGGNVAAKDNNIFTSNKNRNNLLLKACSRGDVSKIKFFVRNGHKVNDCNEGGETPLHAAAQSGHVAAVRELVRLGANVNTTNNNGETPLDIATKNKHEDVVKVLKEYSA